MFLNYHKPEKGKLLIANPFLPDPNFMRSVILLTEYGENGSVGYVLNKPLKVKLSDAVTAFENVDAPLFYGGPVQKDTLHFIHNLGGVISGGTEVLEGVFWSGNYETLNILAKNGDLEPDQLKFFAGYSGWGVGQLDKELEENTWIISEADHEIIFCNDPEKLWQLSLRKMGGRFAEISNYPQNPRLN